MTVCSYSKKKKYSIALDPDPNWAKILDAEPNSMYLDPQHWLALFRFHAFVCLLAFSAIARRTARLPTSGFISSCFLVFRRTEDVFLPSWLEGLLVCCIVYSTASEAATILQLSATSTFIGENQPHEHRLSGVMILL